MNSQIIKQEIGKDNGNIALTRKYKVLENDFSGVTVPTPAYIRMQVTCHLQISTNITLDS